MELTFSIGDLIALFVAVIPTVFYFASVKSKVESLEKRFDDYDEKLNKFEYKLESLKSSQNNQQVEITEIRTALMASRRKAFPLAAE